jgi:hypothetical protein
LLCRPLRKHLLSLLQTLHDHQLAAGTLKPLFGFVVRCVQRRFLSQKDMLDVFEDLFECCPEQKLEELFPLFAEVVSPCEEAADLSNTAIRFEENNLHFCTKICRTIMNKLTVTHDLKFRGTIQMFLAKTLPLTHRSGVNLRGFLNTQNTTTLDEFP